MPNVTVEVTVEQVQKVLGSKSMASVRSWLKAQGVTLPASRRAAIAERVLKLITDQKVTIDQVEAGLIEIEEAGGKRIHLYRIDPIRTNLETIENQLQSLTVTPASGRVAAPALPSLTKRVYLTNDSKSIRAKWAETHTAYIQQLPSLQLRPDKSTKIIVLNFNKATGLIQLRYDKPETTHPHCLGGRTPPAEYYAYFKEQVENLFGLSLEAVELRPCLAKIINASPRIVEVGANEQLTDDGYTIKLAPKLKGKDVRDAKDYGAMNKHGAAVRVHEVESVTWLVAPSNGKITRTVRTHIDGRESYIRFDADCHEAEIDYVLAQLV
jgi:hypothetical protein